jgi:hypothetical protein
MYKVGRNAVTRASENAPRVDAVTRRKIAAFGLLLTTCSFFAYCVFVYKVTITAAQKQVIEREIAALEEVISEKETLYITESSKVDYSMLAASGLTQRDPSYVVRPKSVGSALVIHESF